MEKSKFSESQIVAILKEGEAGLPVAQILRKQEQRHVLRVEVSVRRRQRSRTEVTEGENAKP